MSKYFYLASFARISATEIIEKGTFQKFHRKSLIFYGKSPMPFGSIMRACFYFSGPQFLRLYLSLVLSFQSDFRLTKQTKNFYCFILI